MTDRREYLPREGLGRRPLPNSGRPLPNTGDLCSTERDLRPTEGDLAQQRETFAQQRLFWEIDLFNSPYLRGRVALFLMLMYDTILFRKLSYVKSRVILD
jgi:hypothetical protein